MVVPHKVQIGVDDHAFIMIEREHRPTISIDQSRDGVLSIRVNGNFMFNMSTFIEPRLKSVTEPNREVHRFCPLCGEEIIMWSSAPHHCKENNVE